MLGGVKAHYDCIKAFSETDFTEDLKKIDVPTLIKHGDDDQIVPIGAAGLMSAKIIKNAALKVYPGFPTRDVHNACRSDQCRPACVLRS
jgi:non-heme chloroperoxidase